MSTDADALIRRKDEHIDHVRAGRGVSQTTSGLDAVRFVHDALPDIDHDAIGILQRHDAVLDRRGEIEDEARRIRTRPDPNVFHRNGRCGMRESGEQQGPAAEGQSEGT